MAADRPTGRFPDPESGIFILDCDDVLQPWAPGAVDFALRSGLIEAHPGPQNTFDLALWLGIPVQAVRELIAAYNDGEGTGFGDAPALPGAIEAVRSIHAAGYRIRVLSSASRLAKTQEVRAARLTTLFGDVFDEIRCIPPGSSKLEELRRHPPSVFVDDYIGNIHSGVQAGHTSIVMIADHNRSDFESYAKGQLAVRSWDELLHGFGLKDLEPPVHLDAAHV